jgi:hypothetical protein
MICSRRSGTSLKDTSRQSVRSPRSAVALVAVDREDYFLDYRSQELLLVARARRRRVPDPARSAPRASKRSRPSCPKLRDRCCRPRASPALAGLKLDETLLPVALQAASDQPVFGVDSAITTLGSVDLIGCPFGGGPLGAYPPTLRQSQHLATHQMDGLPQQLGGAVCSERRATRAGRRARLSSLRRRHGML